MILPVGISPVIRGLPWLTITIIALCTAIHIYSAHVAPSTEQVRAHIEQRLQQAEDSDERDVGELLDQLPWVRYGYRTGSGVSWRLITSAFVHADWLHLIGNMFFLWLVGAALEDRWGRVRLALFYLFGAIASALVFSAHHEGSPTILIGASGAISALLGAFLVCFARMQIQFVCWFGRAIGRFDAAASVVLPLWLAEEMLRAWMANTVPGQSSIAFTAHIGGFLFGFAPAFVATQMAVEGVEPPRAIARTPCERPSRSISNRDATSETRVDKATSVRAVGRFHAT
jgi:membrane associated rhomboid family serine protease